MSWQTFEFNLAIYYNNKRPLKYIKQIYKNMINTFDMLFNYKLSDRDIIKIWCQHSDSGINK